MSDASHGNDAARFHALEALAKLTAAIARASKPAELYDAALAALTDALGAERASILLYDREKVMRFCAWHGLSDQYRAKAEGHSPWPPDAKDPQIVVVPDSEADDELAPLRPAFRAEGIRALAFIPLVARGTLIGKFMVYWPQPHQLDEVEREAVVGIAERVALGINRLRTEEALRASRDQLEAILRGIADGVTVLDRTGRMVFANPAAARLMEMSSVEEVLSTPTAQILGQFEMLDEEGSELDLADLPTRRALAGEHPPPMKIRFRSQRDGREHWSEVTSSPVLDPQGEVELVISIFREVTDAQVAIGRERFLAGMQEVLSSSLDFEETLSALARLAVPALADWCRIDMADAQGDAHVVAVEHRDPAMVSRAREMMERYPTPRESSSVLQVIHTGRSMLVPLITDAMLEQRSSPPEFVAFLREIGIRSAMIVPLTARGRTLAALSLISTGRGHRFDESDLAFAEDVGRRAGLALDNALLFGAEQEARRREAQARAEAELANRAKDEFLATLSHELRTPLTAILGWSRMLTTMNPDAQLREEGMLAIARSAEAQARIVEDLLDVSRIVTGKLHIETSTVPLRTVLEAAAASVRPAANARRIAIVFTGDAGVVVRGDADRLQQVFWNLLANAVRFTQPGGRIEVAAGTSGGSVAVTVRDNGSGISADLLPFIFDRFRQGDTGSTRSHGGLGLGLAIVKSLVELHGGTVRAESGGPGQGSAFTVVLPLAAEEEFVAAEPAARRTTLAGRSILLVDDDEATRAFLATLLRQAGAEVRAAGDVPAALEMFRENAPSVVVSDIAMPGEDGYALIRQVRAQENGSHVPAVALTAYGRAEDHDAAISAGFTAFLRKPVDPATFVEIVAGLT